MMYLTEEQKRKLSYAGKRLDDETEKELLPLPVPCYIRFSSV